MNRIVLILIFSLLVFSCTAKDYKYTNSADNSVNQTNEEVTKFEIIKDDIEPEESHKIEKTIDSGKNCLELELNNQQIKFFERRNLLGISHMGVSPYFVFQMMESNCQQNVRGEITLLQALGLQFWFAF